MGRKPVGGKSQAFPRDLAVRVLTRVLSDGHPLDEALEQTLARESSAGEVRGWLREVCAGTLRWKGRLDLVLDSNVLKKKPSGWLRKVMLVGCYQLVVQERVQPGAIVSETVNEVRRHEGEAPAKFANACLRKISTHAEKWRDLPFAPGMSMEEGARWASLPPWIWKRITTQQGEEWAKAYSLAALERPRTWIRARRPEWTPPQSERGPVEGSWRLSDGGPVFEKEGFQAGEFIVQDVSSQLLVEEIGDFAREMLGAHPRALDLCAAPGGKAVGLGWKGFDVLATDKDENRLELLRSTVERVSPEIRILGRDEVAGLSPVDLVWVDAPCTGSGIIRRHPDVRWLRREDSLQALCKVQQTLLDEAWSKVKSGGLLAYSVCSVLDEEGPAAMREFLDRNGSLARLIREWALAPHIPPFGDGFWAAIVRKN